jgi:hypothetical protein
MHAHSTYDVKNEDLAHAIDLEVIKERTHEASETTRTREDFRQNLLERDPCCLWTGCDSQFGSGMHIIPHRRGSEVRSIIKYWYIILSDCLPFSLATFSGFGSL